jgi:DNA-binding response OmpR family regulator
MTAHDLEGARVRCLTAGINDHVAKPVTLQALPAVLRPLRRLDKKVSRSDVS